MFVAVGIQLAKKLLTLYLSAIPTYSAVYGAFATVPILLVWIYLAWLIVLTGAVLAAWWPSINLGASRVPTAHGWHFQLALEVLQQLGQSGGATKTQLARALHVDPPQLEPALHALLQLDWIGQLDEVVTDAESRLVLLADLGNTPLAPLAEHLLLQRTPETQAIWQSGLADATALRSLLVAKI